MIEWMIFIYVLGWLVTFGAETNIDDKYHWSVKIIGNALFWPIVLGKIIFR